MARNWSLHRIVMARYRGRRISFWQTGKSRNDEERHSRTAQGGPHGETIDLGMGEVHRGGAGDLDGRPITAGGSVPDPVREHGKHPADRRLPVREQDAVWRGNPPD